MKFKTKRCLVRPFEERDIGAFMAYRNDLPWMRYQGFKGLTEAEYRAALLGKCSPEDGVQLAVVQTGAGALIGDLYLKREAGDYWIGYTVSPKYAGRGYAREAVSGLISRLKEEGGERILASTLSENAASKGLLKALGFTFAGTDEQGEELYAMELRGMKQTIGTKEGTGMKTIGLIGGMSWESTVTYYRIVNETVKERLGGLHSAKCLIYSVDFAEIEEYQARGEWEKSGQVLAAAAAGLEKAGADFILICTNTMHKVAPRIQAEVSIPVVHIADATADELIAHGISKTALLGTKYTVTEDFYKRKLTERGIGVLIPEAEDIELVNTVIYRELCLGIVSERSRQELRRIVKGLAEKGAQAAVLGCTELGLLLRQEDTQVPLFDTTVIHAARAAELAMG